jgi:hypothetical protein
MRARGIWTKKASAISRHSVISAASVCRMLKAHRPLTPQEVIL